MHGPNPDYSGYHRQITINDSSCNQQHNNHQENFQQGHVGVGREDWWESCLTIIDMKPNWTNINQAQTLAIEAIIEKLRAMTITAINNTRMKCSTKSYWSGREDRRESCLTVVMHQPKYCPTSGSIHRDSQAPYPPCPPNDECHDL